MAPDSPAPHSAPYTHSPGSTALLHLREAHSADQLRFPKVSLPALLFIQTRCRVVGNRVPTEAASRTSSFPALSVFAARLAPIPFVPCSKGSSEKADLVKSRPCVSAFSAFPEKSRTSSLSLKTPHNLVPLGFSCLLSRCCQDSLCPSSVPRAWEPSTPRPF